MHADVLGVPKPLADEQPARAGLGREPEELHEQHADLEIAQLGRGQPMSDHPTERVEVDPARRVDGVGPSVLAGKADARVVHIRRTNREHEQTDARKPRIGVVQLLSVLPAKKEG